MDNLNIISNKDNINILLPILLFYYCDFEQDQKSKKELLVNNLKDIEYFDLKKECSCNYPKDKKLRLKEKATYENMINELFLKFENKTKDISITSNTFMIPEYIEKLVSKTNLEFYNSDFNEFFKYVKKHNLINLKYLMFQINQNTTNFIRGVYFENFWFFLTDDKHSVIKKENTNDIFNVLELLTNKIYPIFKKDEVLINEEMDRILVKNLIIRYNGK